MFSLPPHRSASSSESARARNGESGSALIIAIFLLAVLLSLVVSMARTSQTDLRASSNYAQKVQDDALLDAGIAYAMATLQNDADTGQDSLEDDWATMTDAGLDTYPLGDGAYQVQIIDASSRLNLNTATRDQLLTLPGVTEELADAMIDWRDEDDTPGTNGAESDTYQTYPRPYLAKNAPYDTTDELLMVKGMTPDLLYGDPTQAAALLDQDPSIPSDQSGVMPALADLLTVRSYESNLNATGEARLNLNTVTEQQLTELSDVTISSQQAQAIVNKRNQGQYASIADLLDVQNLPKETARNLIDLVTVTDNQTLEGRINVNTASADVLMTLPGMAENEEAVQNIISNRPFESVGDLLDDSIVPEAVFRQIAPRISTKSSVFIVRVRAQARPGGMIRATEALVERTPDEVHLLSRREVGRWPGWMSWGWTGDVFDMLADQ